MGPDMKLFIWQRIDRATDNYHPEGGVVAIARDLDRAVQLAAGKGATIDKAPDRTLDVRDNTSEEVFIFQDAGCGS